MEFVEGIQKHRLALAAELRSLRERQGISGSELARRIGWTQSRVSRYERGRQSPSEAEILEFIEALDLSADVADRLVTQVRALDTEWNSYRSIMLRGAQQRQSEIQESEAEAVEIRSFQQTLIPGLLQTADYMRALTELVPYQDDEERSDAVRLRMERQEILNDKGKQFWFVVTEGVLWNRFGDVDVMQDQYERLFDATSDKRIRFGIIPRFARLTVLPFSPFTIHDDTLVKIETTASEIVLQMPQDVEDHRNIFEELRSCAVSGRQAQRIIREAAESQP